MNDVEKRFTRLRMITHLALCVGVSGLVGFLAAVILVSLHHELIAGYVASLISMALLILTLRLILD